MSTLNKLPQIIFEDEYLLGINKPALIHSVSLPDSNETSVAQWLLSNQPVMERASTNPGDAGLINRLDFETSGILVAAKDRNSWGKLRSQFEKNLIKKKYRAIIEGAISHQATVEGYIGNRYRGSKKVTFSPQPEKRFQFTHSKISASLMRSADQKCSLVEIKTETGARHQVRVHCASAGHPLLGDSLYGALVQAPITNVPSFMLHACCFSCIHPMTEEMITLEIPDPGYFSVRW